MRIVRAFLVLSIVLVTACDSSSLEGYEHIATRDLDNSLFLEVHARSYGVYGGSSIRYFVTDSTGYRRYIGSCNDKEFFRVFAAEGKVIAEKYSRRNLKNKQTVLINTKHYQFPPH